MFLLTQSLAEYQSVSFSEHVAGPFAEKYYSKYGLGMSVLVLPLYFLGKGLGWILGIDPVFATRFSVSLFNVIVTPTTCVLIYFFAMRRLFFSSHVACWLSLGFGLGTIAWPYSEVFMSEPATALFLLASAYCLTGDRESFGRLTVWAGIFFGLALSLRSASAIALPGFFVYACWTGVVRKGWMARLREGIYFLMPVVCFGLGLLYYNYARFGDAFETGYESGLVPHFWTGFLGMLFSPGKSVFLYNPILLIACFGVPALFRKRPQMAFLLAWIVLSHMMLFSFWHSWFGGMSWGPRLLLAVFPFWILPLGYLAKVWTRVFFKRAIAVVVIAGALIQVPAVSVNMARFYYQLQTQYTKPETLLLYDVAHSPLIGQWRQLAEVLRGMGDSATMQKRTEMALQGTRFAGRNVGEALQWGLAVNAPNFWWYYLKRFGYPMVLFAGPPIVLLCLTLFCGYKLGKHLKDEPHPSSSF